VKLFSQSRFLFLFKHWPALVFPLKNNPVVVVVAVVVVVVDVAAAAAAAVVVSKAPEPLFL